MTDSATETEPHDVVTFIVMVLGALLAFIMMMVGAKSLEIFASEASHGKGTGDMALWNTGAAALESLEVGLSGFLPFSSKR